MRIPALAVVLVVVACGQVPAPNARSGSSPSQIPATSASPSASALSQNSPTPTPQASPSAQAGNGPAAGLLFAVVEGGASYANAPNAVAIVGLDGYAKAKTTFTPRTTPHGCMFAIPLQGVAEVQDNGVYYIDGSGVVRLLQVGHEPQITATVVQPSSQYETWFAVSPDGSQVLAGVVTWPTLGPAATDAPCGLPITTSKFDLELAAGGNTRVLQHSEGSWDTSKLTVDFPVGWTADGPIGMVPVSLGTQSAWWGGPLHVVDSSGNLARQIGGSDCDSASITTSGLIACTSGQYLVTVRDSLGNTLWATQVDGFNALGLRLSPDGRGITDGTKVETRAGGLIVMPQGFIVEGWLDNNTVIGRTPVGTAGDRGNLSWISIKDPTNVHDLGFKGDFVGTIVA